MVAVLLFAGLLAFPYGPLFPWSPIHPGYSELRLARATVLYPSDTLLPEPYRHLDEYITSAERFHRLPVKSRITVVMCRDWNDSVRFILDARSRKVAGATYPFGTVIFITPKVREQGLDHGEFLRHELSHATLDQSQRPWNSFRIMRQQWFAEGLAVSFGEQKAFITPDEFLRTATEGDFGAIIDPDRVGNDSKPLNMRIAYQVWRYFLEHLIETRGRDSFQRYMNAYIEDPSSYRDLFIRVYGTSLEGAIRQFQDDVRRHTWKPNPEFASQQI